jgi:SAM-dependent methyltransferase
MADADQIEAQREQNYADIAGVLNRVTAERDDLARQLDVLYSSRSWTLTAPMRRLAWAARKRFRPNSVPTPVPTPPQAEARTDWPPPELRARVTGVEDEVWFKASGQTALEDISSALARVDRSLGDFARIYDFGCGCGRISLPLTEIVPAANLTATDRDGDATAWLAERLPAASVAANGDLPPLPFADDSFDLIIGWSVMTHLPEDYQDAWLAELARVLAPGGSMLLTIHGPTNFDIVEAPADDPNRKALQEKGFVYFENYGPDSPFAPYYQTTYHHPDYIREHWTQWVDVVDILPGAARPTHDMVILAAR